MELKEELDAFALASLEEYAKLFLEPGAEVRAKKSRRRSFLFEHDIFVPHFDIY